MEQDTRQIEIIGAREHNLKHVSCSLPTGKIIVVTGPSGSGKSSLVFDTLHRQAKLLFSVPSDFAAKKVGFIPWPEVDSIKGVPYTIAVNAEIPRSPFATVATMSEAFRYLRGLFYWLGKRHCVKCGCVLNCETRGEMLRKLSELPTDAVITAYSPLGMHLLADLPVLQNDLLLKGYSRIEINGVLYRLDSEYFREDCSALEVENKGLQVDVSVLIDRFTWKKTRVSRLSEVLELSLRLSGGEAFFVWEKKGGGEGELRFSETFKCLSCGTVQSALQPSAFSYYRPGLGCLLCGGKGETAQGLCAQCLGSRVREEVRVIELAGIRFGSLLTASIAECSSWLSNLSEFKEQLSSGRLNFLDQVLPRLEQLISCLSTLGLDYLTLNRPVTSLSSGEIRRVRLARELHQQFSGAAYLLDEPSVGLHPADTKNLLQVLRGLVGRGATAVVVEHDPEIILAADYLVDLGPGGGEQGGRIVAVGPVTEIAAGCGATAISLRDLREKKCIGDFREGGTRDGILRISHVTKNNLKGVDLILPTNSLVGIAGVSGSGKSSLVIQALVPAIERLFQKRRLVRRKKSKVTVKLGSKEKARYGLSEVEGWEVFDRIVSSSELRRQQNPRSIVATAVGLHRDLRRLYTKTVEARVRGYSEQNFSFNMPLGACPRCGGLGSSELSFGKGRFETPCSLCHGKRYKQEILEIHYKGRSIVDLLGLSVEESATVLQGLPDIQKKLSVLGELGLGYLRLDQQTSTLSSGERQRLMLVSDLTRSARGNTLYVFDEPTTGLHLGEVSLLVRVFRKLVEAGNTVLVIEHNTSLLRCCDHLVELGPGAGAAGGGLVAQGYPIEVSENKKSIIGRYL